MHTYVIGEIGQNHNGSVELAKKLIDVASLPIVDWAGKELSGIDAIKLQKRDLSEELTASAMARTYRNPHSFGQTYGEHRARLELTNDEHFEIYQYAKTKGLDVVETLCSPSSLSLLDLFTPDRLKVASRDLTNLPLLEAMAQTRIPIILSTGMAGEEELETALGVISKQHRNITILHCLSQYPAEWENLNLATIPYLSECYGQYTVGYSDHTEGIVAPVAAVAMGAKVIEKHITLSRGMKGSDHRGSLAPEGMMRMMRDIRHVEQALGKKKMFAHPAAGEARRKLERSVAARRNIGIGEVIQEKDLYLLSPGTGLRWAERHRVIGRQVARPIARDELVMVEHMAMVQEAAR